jgi:molecular chaperone GrpE
MPAFAVAALLVYLARYSMSKDQNNLGMAGATGVNESPLSEEGGNGVAADQEHDRFQGDSLSPEECADLKSKAAKADENWEKFVRATADLDNYKKRALRERQDAVKYANEALIDKLLPIVDNFEAALAAANAPQTGNIDSLRVGINMIHSQLKNFLSEAGVEEIDALNKPFDPNLHEAVSQIASAEAPEGQVLQQMRKGYRFRERLLRPAMVVVAKKP